MNGWLRQLALCFAAGCVGGLAKSAVAWGAWRLGVTILIGAHGAGALSTGVLYPRVIWGGLWAGVFLLTFLRGSVVIGGVLAGLLVTAVQWVLLPLWWHGGISLALMPFLEALLLNLVWGLVSALMLKWL